MSLLVNFSMHRKPVSTETMFVRVFSLDRILVFSGEVPAVGQIDLGDIDVSIGQELLVFGDNYTSENKAEYESFSGFGKVVLNVPNNWYSVSSGGLAPDTVIPEGDVIYKI